MTTLLICMMIVGQKRPDPPKPYPLPSNLVGSLRPSHTKSYKRFRVVNSIFVSPGPDYISVSVSRKMRPDGVLGLTNGGSLRCEVIGYSVLDEAGKKAAQADRHSKGWKKVSYKRWNGVASGSYDSPGKAMAGFYFSSGHREVFIRLVFPAGSREASSQASDLVVDILDSIKETK